MHFSRGYTYVFKVPVALYLLERVEKTVIEYISIIHLSCYQRIFTIWLRGRINGFILRLEDVE